MMSFFQNLSLGKKLAIAILVFNVSTVLMMYYLITEKDGLIDFTKQEIDGVEYLRAAQSGMQALTSLTLSSDALSAAAAKLKQAQIDDNGALSVGPKSDDTQAALLAATSKGTADGLAKTTDLISTISDNSNITLDPDADAYFVGDILVNQATALLTQTNALIGAAHDLDADKSDDHKIAFAEARDGISAAAGTFAADLAKALKGNKDESVKDNLSDKGGVVAAAVDKVIAASKTDDRKALTTAASDLLQAVNGFVIKDAEEMDHLLNGRINGFHSVMIMQTTIVLLLLLVGAVISWFVTRSVTKPINLITGLMGRLTKGDLDIEVPQDNRTDEIGGLIVALKGFYEASVERNKARKVEREREEADRARAARIQTLSDTFNSSVRNALENLNTAVENLNGMANGMAKDSETASRQATAVAAAAEEASTNVHTVAAASEELSASIKEISSRIAHSNTVAQQAAQEAKQTKAVVHILSEATDKIGDVVNLINQIAGQTNLLALNATIEAARAGEAGKGFAVVASEVKALANQTAKATEDITGHISSIQEAVKNVAKAIENIDGIIGQINEVSVTISGAVEEQGAATQEIARNVQQAAQGTSEVTNNIAQIAQTIASTDGASREVLESAKALGTEAAKLEKDVGTYLTNVKSA